MKFRKHLVKIGSIILTAVLLLSFSATAFAAQGTPFGYVSIKTDAADTFASQNQAAIERVYQGAMNHEQSIYVYDLQLQVSDFYAFGDVLNYSYPELFFVYNYGISYSGNYIYAFYLNYSYDQATASRMLTEFYAEADKYLGLIENDMDDFTKAVVLHDALEMDCYYQIQADDGEYSSNYTFMVKKWGRCENYTQVYSYLLAQVGIKSEIINSDNMNHQWMKICLGSDEYYYNVDSTWNDPDYGENKNPGFTNHDFFLISDEMIQDEDIYGDYAHYGYDSIHATSTDCDNKSNLHSLTRPFYYINGELYTLYEKNNKGYIATYDFDTDSFTDLYQINDVWYTSSGSSYWAGNFSGLACSDGILYYNTPNAVYSYDPITGTNTLVQDNIAASPNRIYGLYIENDKINVMTATSPAGQNQDWIEVCDVPVRYTAGDVNEDGAVNILDVTEIQRFVATYRTFTTAQALAADYDGNGVITIGDATAVQVYIGSGGH